MSCSTVPYLPPASPPARHLARFASRPSSRAKSVQLADSARARPRRYSIVWPTILIGFGVLFLAQNLGLVHGDLWWGLWQLWPLLLVAASFPGRNTDLTTEAPRAESSQWWGALPYTRYLRLGYSDV
ncbi:MAG: DUF5668 domain-containing protein [Chloroflexi bacterium]|nr:DUF5668 domain-containing protein [Chloroflexota bacterium]